MSEKLPSELLESLPIRQTVFDGQLYRFRSPALAFYREWRGVPQVLVTEDVAVNAASYLVWEQYRLTDWVLNPITRFFPSRYRYYGLESLSDLFGKSFRSRLKLNLRAVFDAKSLFLPGGNSESKYCTFPDWEKRFWLSLCEFQLIDPDDTSTNARLANLSKKYGLRPLIEELGAALKKSKRPQKHRDFLKAFARSWDVSIVPLRFFSDQAALDYSLENLELTDPDYSNYCKRVHQGGAKRLEGLRLVSQKPYVVTQWTPKIRFDRKAAESHGFVVDAPIELLRMFSGRKVLTT